MAFQGENARVWLLIDDRAGNKSQVLGVARAAGAYGDTIETTAQFIPAVESALAAGKVAVLDVRYDANIISTTTTLDAIRQTALKTQQ